VARAVSPVLRVARARAMLRVAPAERVASRLRRAAAALDRARAAEDRRREVLTLQAVVVVVREPRRRRTVVGVASPVRHRARWVSGCWPWHWRSY
jgi:hypothetical protein